MSINTKNQLCYAAWKYVRIERTNDLLQAAAYRHSASELRESGERNTADAAIILLQMAEELDPGVDRVYATSQLALVLATLPKG